MRVCSWRKKHAKIVSLISIVKTGKICSVKVLFQRMQESYELGGLSVQVVESRKEKSNSWRQWSVYLLLLLLLLLQCLSMCCSITCCHVEAHQEDRKLYPPLPISNLLADLYDSSNLNQLPPCWKLWAAVAIPAFCTLCTRSADRLVGCIEPEDLM